MTCLLHSPSYEKKGCGMSPSINKIIRQICLRNYYINIIRKIEMSVMNEKCIHIRNYSRLLPDNL